MHPGFIPRNHPNAVKKQGVDDSIDDRETPPCVFDPLNAEFRFTLDAAASHVNAKCDVYCTLEGQFAKMVHADGSRVGWEQLTDEYANRDGLRCPWHSERVWVNPPFSLLWPWVEKAWREPAEVVCMLLPNNRTEQPFWQDMVEPFRDRAGSILTTRFVRKRRPFLHMGQGIGNRTSKNPPFGLVLLIWDRRNPTAQLTRTAHPSEDRTHST
jgi:hypothetical protein